ncbi:FtsX-like permease family protein [Embleya hyalina]|uniref:Membrane protein n=1 Tax=Embleya hyalina TaxID=516124 RepID=A0A401YUJ4_9ACTN|nr:FtsX-like permease family protein [Embleya hyalina]GCD98293.1 membrane protein [Embleya hyalina]
MSVGSWRACLRIARRDALRAKGRSALIVAMIAIPVLGMSAADVTWRSAQLDPDELISRTLGQADARVRDTAREHGALIPGQLPTPIRQDPEGNDWQTVPLEAASPPSGSPPSGAGSGGAASTGTPAADPVSVIPGITETLTDRSAYATVSTAYGRGGVSVHEFDYTKPLAKGMVIQRGGRAPVARDEVVVTRRLARSAGYRVGGQLTESSTGRAYRIVGTVDLPQDLRAITVFALPGALIDALPSGSPASGSIEPETATLIRVSGGLPWNRVLEANRHGLLVRSAAVLRHPPARSELSSWTPRQWADSHALRLGGIGVGLGLLEMILLAGPAFAVGARRRRRELGLIGVAGGSRRHIGGVVLGGGLVLGAVGALLGTSLGLAVAALTRSWFAERTGRLLGHYDVRPLELLGIGGVGVAIGVLAALIPAWLAAREDVAASLTGRRGVRRGSRLLPIAGTTGVALGAAIAMYGADRADETIIVVGVVVAELGLVACCPALIGLTARLGRFLPLSARLALRDAARSRPRSAPAMAAVMAAVAGSVAVAVVWTSQTADERHAYRPNALTNHVLVGVHDRDTFPGRPAGAPVTAGQMEAVRSAVERTLPRAKGGSLGSLTGPCTPDRSECAGYRVRKLPRFRCPIEDGGDPARWHADPRCVFSSPGNGFFRSVVGDADTLRKLTGADDPRAAEVLARGGIVLFEDGYIGPDGTAEVTAYRNGAGAGGMSAMEKPDPARPVVRLPAVTVRAPFGLGGGIFASPAAAATLGATPEPVGAVYDAGRSPSDAQKQRLEESLARISDRTFLFVERGFQGRDDVRLLLLAVFALVITIGASGVATGLALADGRRDLATLGAVGAPPGVRRRLSAFQSGVIAFLGTVLGLVVGVLAGVVVRRGQRAALWDTLPPAIQARLHAPTVVVPWSRLALALVVLPLLAGLLAALLTRSRAVLRGRTA